MKQIYPMKLQPVYISLFGIIPIIKITKTITPTSITKFYWLFYCIPLFTTVDEYETTATQH